MEAISCTVTASTPAPEIAFPASVHEVHSSLNAIPRKLYSLQQQRRIEVPVYSRAAINVAGKQDGPLLVVDEETTTLVDELFAVSSTPEGHLVLERQSLAGGTQ